MEETFTAVLENGRIVIPEPICRLLGLRAGDIVRFRASSDRVTIEKVRDSEDDHFATFSEWNSVEDDGLYRNL